MDLILRATFFENVDPRRKQERQDARMIREDHTKMANLSDQAIHREFNAWQFPERLNMYDESDR
jgi:hypothetical protein